jgi:hypothetical protein
MEMNSIGALRKMSVRPARWRVLRAPAGEGEWMWGITFHWGASADSADDWHELRTARGERRLYKSSDAALNDIASVDPDRPNVEVLL